MVIVYASLQPFEGWRLPPQELRNFLSAPWPHYYTAGDVALNIVAYLPLGAMLFACLRPPLSPAAAFPVATLLTALLSLAVESAQMFLPARVASNLDILANTLGAAIGALAAGLLALPALQPLTALRHRVVRAGALGDCGMVLIAWWLVIQFYPAPLALGSGDWRETLHISPYFPHTPQAYLAAEAGVVAFAVASIGLLVSLVLRPQQRAARAVTATILLTIAVKSAASAMIGRGAHWLQWLTPGAWTGITCGALLLAVLLRLAPAPRAAAAVVCIMAGVLLINVTPENPYYAVPVFMFSPQLTHLMNFTHIVRTLSLLWPLLAGVYLISLAKAERPAPRL